MFKNVDGRRTTDAGVIGILIAHLGAFGSGELKRWLFLTGNGAKIRLLEMGRKSHVS